MAQQSQERWASSTPIAPNLFTGTQYHNTFNMDKITRDKFEQAKQGQYPAIKDELDEAVSPQESTGEAPLEYIQKIGRVQRDTFPGAVTIGAGEPFVSREAGAKLRTGEEKETVYRFNVAGSLHSYSSKEWDLYREYELAEVLGYRFTNKSTGQTEWHPLSILVGISTK